MRGRRLRRILPALATVSLGAVVHVSLGQAREEPGITAGRWILAPLVFAQWGYDTNPFYGATVAEGSEEASSRYALGMGAVLPFRESRLGLGYRRDHLRYEKTTLNEDTVDEVQGDLGLRFSSGDDLTLRTSWTRGVADTLRFDPGGETVFRGDPYRYRDLSLIAGREAAGRAGYEVAISRRDLNFPEEAEGVSYFEYRGWDLRGEYRHPVRRSLALTAGYGGRRFRHFCDDLEASGEPCPPTGTPFRHETGNSVLVGVRGLARERSPFAVRLGWLDLDYGGRGDSGFAGPVGDASVRVALSASTWVEGTVLRQAYSSFYRNNNHFLYSAAQTRVGIRRGTRLDSAVGVLYARTSYDVPDASGLIRQDRTLRIDAYANLLVSGRFGLRFAAADEQRSSTIPGAGFGRRLFVVGAFYGWL